MSKKRIGLLVTAVLFAAYLVVSIPYYVSEGARTLEGFPIFAAIYVQLLTIHATLCAAAVVIEWLGFLLKRQTFLTFASILLFLGGIFMFPGYLVIIPLLILNAIFRIGKTPKPQSKTPVLNDNNKS